MKSKKILPLLMVCALALSACGSKSGNISDSKNAASWIDIYGAEVSKDFIPTKYNMSYKSATLKPDLSNLINKDDISGFSQDQKNKLVKNGFVVLK